MTTKDLLSPSCEDFFLVPIRYSATDNKPFIKAHVRSVKHATLVLALDAFREEDQLTNLLNAASTEEAHQKVDKSILYKDVYGAINGASLAQNFQHAGQFFVSATLARAHDNKMVCKTICDSDLENITPSIADVYGFDITKGHKSPPDLRDEMQYIQKFLKQR